MRIMPIIMGVLAVSGIVFVGACDAGGQSVQTANSEQEKVAVTSAEVIHSEQTAPSLSSSSEKQTARENDQLLEKALDDPDQQKRADLAMQVHLRPAYYDCVKKAGGVTSELLDCNAKEYRYQDAMLNQRYRERMARLDASQQTVLRDKQRKWIKSRDALCNLKGILGGGQAELLEQNNCNLNATAKRADELGNGDLKW